MSRRSSSAQNNVRRALNRASAVLRHQARLVEQHALSPDEIDERLIAAITEAIVARGTVSQRDLVATNVPAAAIEQRFTYCFEEACRRHPKVVNVEAFA